MITWRVGGTNDPFRIQAAIKSTRAVVVSLLFLGGRASLALTLVILFLVALGLSVFLEFFDQILAVEVLLGLPGVVLVAVALPLEKIFDFAWKWRSVLTGCFGSRWRWNSYRCGRLACQWLSRRSTPPPPPRCRMRHGACWLGNWTENWHKLRWRFQNFLDGLVGRSIGVGLTLSLLLFTSRFRGREIENQANLKNLPFPI